MSDDATPSDGQNPDPDNLMDFTDWVAPDGGALFGVSCSNVIASGSIPWADTKLDFLAMLRVFRGFVRYTDEELQVKAQTSRYWAQRLRYRAETDRRADVRARHGARYPR